LQYAHGYVVDRFRGELAAILPSLLAASAFSSVEASSASRCFRKLSFVLLVFFFFFFFLSVVLTRVFEGTFLSVALRLQAVT